MHMQLTDEKIQRIIDSYSIGQLISIKPQKDKLIEDISFIVFLLETTHGSFYLVGAESMDLITKKILPIMKK